MRTAHILGILTLTLTAALPVAAEPLGLFPATHEEIGRAIDELAGHIRGLGQYVPGHSTRSEPPAERPLISIMLSHRQELGLSPSQVQELERLRAEFQREAIKREADQRVADMDLTALLSAEPVDMLRVEAKLREVERLRTDLRLARLRTIEQGKAQLTVDQRAKLASLLSETRPFRPRAGTPPPPPPASQKL